MIDDVIKNTELEDVQLGYEPIEPKGFSRREFLRSMARAALGTMLVSEGIGAGLLKYLKEKSEALPINERNGLAILISKPGNPIEKFGSAFADVYISRIELAFGFRPSPRNIIIGAVKDDLNRILYDPSVQNISILGHGDWGSWEASDGELVTHKLRVWYSENPCRKRGFFLKHTCGEIPSGENGFLLSPGGYSQLKDKIIKINGEIYETGYSFDWIVKDFQKFGDIKLYVGKKEYKLNLDQNIKTKEGISKFLSKNIKEKFVASKIDMFISEIFETFNDASKMEPNLLGYPFFEPKHIAAWSRVTAPDDFLRDPFAKQRNKMDKCLQAVKEFYANI